MPYIDEDRRDLLDGGEVDPETSGELNYVITMTIADWLKSRPRSYAAINTAIGILECAKLELYRRIAAPYEDRKCAEHGDVY